MKPTVIVVRTDARRYFFALSAITKVVEVGSEGSHVMVYAIDTSPTRLEGDAAQTFLDIYEKCIEVMDWRGLA